MAHHAGRNHEFATGNELVCERGPRLGIRKPALTPALELLVAARALLGDLLDHTVRARRDDGSVHGMVPIIGAVLGVARAKVEAPDPSKVARSATGNGGHMLLAAVFGKEKAIFQIVLNGNRHVPVVVKVAGNELGLSLLAKIVVEEVRAPATAFHELEDARPVLVPRRCPRLAGGHPLVRSALLLFLVALREHQNLICAAIVAGTRVGQNVVGLTIAVVLYQTLKANRLSGIEVHARLFLEHGHLPEQPAPDLARVNAQNLGSLLGKALVAGLVFPVPLANEVLLSL